MAINDLGIVRPGSTILFPFATYSSDDPSASVVVSDFVLADIGIYKGTSMTERGSTTGVVLLETDGIDIDGAVGIHGFTIDLSSNATADFYNVGDQYYVTVGTITIDAATINALVGTFRIGYPGAIHETNIATLSSQVSFTLDAGSADDDAYNGCVVYIHAIASAVQVCFGYVSDYDETTGTLTVTLKADPGIYTIAAGDNISFFPPSNVQAVAGTTQTAGNITAAVITNAQGADVATDVAAMIDVNNRVDVGSFLGTAVVLSNGLPDTNVENWLGTIVTAETAGRPDVNITAVSDDTVAATNLELQYDTTGLTGDEFPATQAQVGKIGSSSGGSLSFAAEIDNAITATIDNAAAVDKGSGLVGIPITGHAFTADFQVTIASTTNYNGSFTVISKTTNEIVITASFVSETFGGSETCVATIKTIAKIGTLTSGTFVSTEAQDTVHQVLTNASDNLDWAFQYDVGGGRTASKIVFFGYLTSNNDSMNIQAYDFVGTDWETRAVLSGTSQTTDQTLDISLLAKHTGTTGADIGKVLIRFVDATAAGHVLGIDLMLVEAVGIGQTVGYEQGAVWIDTDDGVAGTESFVNGVADNPILTLADAITIAANVKLHRFICTPDSSITFAEAHTNEVWQGEGATLALGGQDCSGCHFMGMDVSGTATGSTEIHFDHCEIGNVTVADAHFDECDIEGVVTLSAAANYNFVSCAHSGTAATIDVGSGVGNTTVHVHNYHGALTVQNMGQNGTDVLHFSSSNGKLTLDNTNTGGTVNLNGTFDFVNSGSGQTINDDGAILETVGIITDSAAAGDPTSTDTIVQYVKQLVNILVGTDGVTTFPAAAAPGNGVSLAEVIRATYDDTNSLDGTKIPDTISLANINAEVDNALDTAISELGVATPTATPTVRTALMLMYMALRNKLVVQTSGTDALEIYNDAGTKIASKLLTDDGADYTEAEMS